VRAARPVFASPEMEGCRVLLLTIVTQEPSASALLAKVPITAEDCKQNSGIQGSYPVAWIDAGK
jgi:hypothetical protein